MFTRSAAKQRGMSLVEVMVAAFLGSLVLYVLISTLVPALKASAVGSTRVSLDQRGTLATMRLIRALKSTSRGGLMTESPSTGQTVLSIHPIEGIGPDSRQVWANSLVLYSWKEGKLQESQVPLDPPVTKATTLPFDDLVARPGQPRFVVDKVDEFSAVLTDGPRVDFRLVLQEGKDKLTIARTVFLENSSQ